MGTTVSARMGRSYTPDMFADLTDVEHTRAFDRATQVTTLCFAANLPPETAQAVWARMESADDTDQAARAALRSAAAAGASNLAAMHLAYFLRDPLPDAVLPTPEPASEPAPEPDSQQTVSTTSAATGTTASPVVGTTLTGSLTTKLGRS